MRSRNGLLQRSPKSRITSNPLHWGSGFTVLAIARAVRRRSYDESYHVVRSSCGGFTVRAIAPASRRRGVQGGILRVRWSAGSRSSSAARRASDHREISDAAISEFGCPSRMGTTDRSCRRRWAPSRRHHRTRRARMRAPRSCRRSPCAVSRLRARSWSVLLLVERRPPAANENRSSPRDLARA